MNRKKQQRFSFDLEQININFDPELADNPEQWQFYFLKPIPEYRVALSVSKNINIPMMINTKKVVPLNKAETLVCEMLNQSY